MFSYSGKFWSYKDVAIWPRPVQQPHPPIWIPIVGSKESIEFAGRHNIPITPGLGGGGLRDDIIRYYAKCLAAAGHKHHARSPVARRQRLCRRFQGAGDRGDGALSPLFQSHAVQPRQLHRDGAAAAGGLFEPELDRLCAAGEPARGPAAARGFPQHDDGRRRAPGREPAVGHAARKWPSASSPRPSTPAPTWCRSASIAAPCRRRCSSSRSAASPRDVLPVCRRTRSSSRRRLWLPTRRCASSRAGTLSSRGRRAASGSASAARWPGPA